MHGEYKVPGGKLVVVDLDVVDNVITDFRLAGDFFLEPDDALEDINAAVNGLAADSDAATIAAAVRAALPAAGHPARLQRRNRWPWPSAARSRTPAAGATTSGSSSTPRPCRR